IAPSATRRSLHQVDIDQVHFVDSQVVAFDRIGGKIGHCAHYQYHRREGDPGQLQSLDDFLEKQIVQRTDDHNINQDEQSDPAEGNHGHVFELLEADLEIASHFAAKIVANAHLVKLVVLAVAGV